MNEGMVTCLVVRRCPLIMVTRLISRRITFLMNIVHFAFLYGSWSHIFFYFPDFLFFSSDIEL